MASAGVQLLKEPGLFGAHEEKANFRRFHLTSISLSCILMWVESDEASHAGRFLLPGVKAFLTRFQLLEKRMNCVGSYVVSLGVT